MLALRASIRCSTPAGSDPAAASARTSCPRHGAHLHVYVKAARAGRKLGHATVRAPHEPDVLDALSRLRALVDLADWN